MALAVFCVYFPAHHYPFADIDDDAYVYENAHITGPLNLDTLRFAFTQFYCDNFVPIDFLSHNIDVQLFGLNAGAHHDVNILLHAVNAILLFWILKRATGYTARSWTVAALFALHPINVENVAWISERKTILSTLFFLLALAAYRWYAANPEFRRMGVVWLCYSAGLLAKPQIIAFPFVLLLWDYWPLRRLGSYREDAGIVPGIAPLPLQKLPALLSEKLLLFATALADAVLTMHGEKGARSILDLPLYIRLGNAVRSYAIYIEKAFWPNHLNLMNLHPGYLLPWGQVACALVLLLAVSTLVIVKRDYRYLAVGWVWFLGTMAPTIGIVQFQVQAWADRYAYIAYIGLFIMCCWGIAEFAARRPVLRPIVSVAGLMILVALSVATRKQVEVWRDRVSLWTRVLEFSPMHRNWIAESRLGDYYFLQNDGRQALVYYLRAAEDRPGDFLILAKLGQAEHKQGHLDRALSYYRKAIAASRDHDVDPKFLAQVLANIGHIYDRLGDPGTALQYYRSAQQVSASIPGQGPRSRMIPLRTKRLPDAPS